LEGCQISEKEVPTPSPVLEHKRSVSQLSNVTESTQSTPGDKVKAKKKRKPRKKKTPADATAPHVETTAGPSSKGDVKASTDGGDSDDTEIIFTPPGSIHASPDSKLFKKPQVDSSGLLQAPRNTLQMRKQKQSRKTSVIGVAEEVTGNSKVASDLSKAPASIRPHLATLGSNIKYIDLTGQKAPTALPAAEGASKSNSPSQDEDEDEVERRVQNERQTNHHLQSQIQESVRKLEDMEHQEALKKLQAQSDEEGIRREEKRYAILCNKREQDKLVRFLSSLGYISH